MGRYSMRILCIGDVCGSIGCEYLKRVLPKLKRDENIDCCIVNGENSADSNGITPTSLDSLYAAGADVITGGNHSLRRREAFDAFESDPFLLRPHNMITFISETNLSFSSSLNHTINVSTNSTPCFCVI